MSLKEKLSGTSVAGVGTSVFLVLAALALVYSYYSSRRGNIRGDPSLSFYSDDDGQTFFKDSAFHFPPFDHNGKTAYGALVFDDGTKQFVGYLCRFTPAAQKALEDAYNNPPAGETGPQAALALAQTPQIHDQGMQIKKNGENWMPGSSFVRVNAVGADGTPALPVAP